MVVLCLPYGRGRPISLLFCGGYAFVRVVFHFLPVNVLSDSLPNLCFLGPLWGHRLLVISTVFIFNPLVGAGSLPHVPWVIPN